MEKENVPPDASATNDSIFITVFRLLGILLHYKVMIIVVTAVAALLAVGFSILTLQLPPEINPMPNVYRSMAVIRLQAPVSTLSMDSLFASIGGGRGLPSSQADPTLDVQLILNSGAFLDKLVEEFDIIEKYSISDRIKTNSRQIMRNRLSHNYDRNSGLLYISSTTTDPYESRNTVNRTIELLQEWFLKEGGSVRTRQMEMLEDRMRETEEQIHEFEVEIREFQTRYGVLTVEALASQIESILSELQSQLVQVDMEINQYTRYARIEDPALARLRAQRQNIMSTINQMDRGYAVSGRTLPSREELSDLSLRFARLYMDLQIQQDIYQALAQRYEVMRLAAIEESVFNILEWGEVPEDKIGPMRGQICIQITMMAFIFSVALAFGIHYLKLFLKDPAKLKLLQYLKGK